MRTRTIPLILVGLLGVLLLAGAADKKKDKQEPRALRVVQISDLHLGLRTHPEGEAHAQAAIAMINDMHPDLVLVSGDISENKPEARRAGVELLKQLNAPYKTVPGNHDVHDDDMGAYRAAYGEDYYSFDLGGMRFIGLNSQLMGNYDNFSAPQAVPNTKAAGESNDMFKWLAGLPVTDETTFVFQHVPITHDGAPDDKPYWGVSEPYLSRELEQLKRLRVKDMFAGHWHNPQTKEVQGITVHIAPAVSYGIKSDDVGVMLYTIQPNGEVKAEMVPLQK